MRRVTTIFCLLFFASLTFSVGANDIIYSSIRPIEMKYKNKTKSNSGIGSPQKAPLAPFTIYQNDNMLTFGLSSVGCSVMLVQDDEIILTTVVSEEGTVELPADLFGEYEVQIEIGNFIYFGIVEFL